MTNKKIGKISLLLQIPNLFVFTGVLINYENTHGRWSNMPGGILWMCISGLTTTVSFMMIENLTPLQLYRYIIKFINE